MPAKVESEFLKRAKVKAEASGFPATTDFMQLIMDVILSLMDGCRKSDTDEVVERLKNPGFTERFVIRRSARKHAMQGRFSNPDEIASQASDVLISVGQESTPEEIKQLVSFSRDSVPEFNLI